MAKARTMKTNQTRRKRKSSGQKSSVKSQTSSSFLEPSPVSANVIRPKYHLPSVWQLTIRTMVFLWRYKHLFMGISVVYGLLNLVLVQGLASTNDVGTLKAELDQAFTGQLGHVVSGFGVFVDLLGSAGGGSTTATGAYQFSLLVIVSLALIWALRQTLAGSRVRVRDAYYRGMYPLVQFIIILFIVGVQLLPLVIGTKLYQLVIVNGIVTTGIEIALFGIIALALALWSIYLISSSLLALYIVTLPDMTPLKAFRSARELTRGRRWTVARKILFLPLLLLIVAVIIMLPIIILITVLAPWVFFVLTVLATAAVHCYMYTLYRELLHE